jgi:hypothetical protein
VTVLCQSCGQLIAPGSPVVRVVVGELHITAHPHAGVRRPSSNDFFHAGCDVAVPDPVAK